MFCYQINMLPIKEKNLDFLSFYILKLWIVGNAVTLNGSK